MVRVYVCLNTETSTADLAGRDLHHWRDSFDHDIFDKTWLIKTQLETGDIIKRADLY